MIALKAMMNKAHRNRAKKELPAAFPKIHFTGEFTDHQIKVIEVFKHEMLLDGCCWSEKSPPNKNANKTKLNAELEYKI